MTIVPLAPEIVWFNPSGSYLANPAEILQTVNKTTEECGLLGAYYGFGVQDPTVAVWIMAWHTLAAHQSFMEHESYIDFALPVMEAMVGSGEITQILLSKHSGFYKAVTSPVTQFIYITLRPRHDMSYELVPLIERLMKELPLVPGYYGSTWGPSVEHENLYVGIVGWGSLADRDRAVKGLLAPTISLVRELATVELKFARLRQYVPR